ncbi:MAG: BMP family protein [Oscillatoria princeps RMCB-10]|jgi:basic membrane lipoprotein Med (substrate-binding protein (PBP1-ABC) superfamily)|nr:BMP family protein [Oscillatoria princeps RMCB-10]
MWGGSVIVRIVLVVSVLLLVSCTGSHTAPAPPEPVPGAFKVAIILTGKVDDGGWSQSGYEGLKLIQKQLGSQVAFTESADLLPEKAVEPLFRKYAADRFDFVIGHSGQYEAVAEAVAKEFTRTKFAIVGASPGNNKNMGAVGFRSGELGYLMGVVAALKSQTHKVAMIAGMPLPDVETAAKLFERGAKATDPDIQVFIEWVNSWTDTEKVKKIARQKIAAKADVLLALTNQGDAAIFEIAAAAGVRALGWVQDQYNRAPNTILTSGLQNVPVMLLEAAILVRQGRWEGKQYRFGLEEGAQDIAPFRGALNRREEEFVSAVKRDILLGKIDVSP